MNCTTFNRPVSLDDGAPPEAEPAVVLGDDERLGAPPVGHAAAAHVVVARVARQPVRVVVRVRVPPRRTRLARERDGTPGSGNRFNLTCLVTLCNDVERGCHKVLVGFCLN